MKMWVTQCIFLHSSTFYHVNLGKSQFSCLDMRFTKVGKKFVKKVFKLDVDIFHQKQPNCKLDSYERATKKENSTISSWDWGRYRSEEMSPLVPFQNKSFLFKVDFVVDPSVFVDASGYQNDHLHVITFFTFSPSLDIEERSIKWVPITVSPTWCMYHTHILIKLKDHNLI